MNASARSALAFRDPARVFLACDWWDQRPPEAPLPRYDYRCVDDACENDTFEVSRSYTDDSATVCPVCNTKAKRLLSPIAVHFKGSGFYVTDNRASNGASGSDSESESSENGSKPEKTESKSESKAEKKSEKKSDSGSKSSKSESKSKTSSSDSKRTSKAASSSK